MKQDLYDSSGKYVGELETGPSDALTGALSLGIVAIWLVVIFSVVGIPLAIFYFGIKGTIALLQGKNEEASKDFRYSGLAFAVTLIAVSAVIIDTNGLDYLKFRRGLDVGVTTAHLEFNENLPKTEDHYKYIFQVPYSATNNTDSEIQIHILFELLPSSCKSDGNCSIWTPYWGFFEQQGEYDYIVWTTIPPNQTVTGYFPIEWHNSLDYTNGDKLIITGCKVEVRYSNNPEKKVRVPCDPPESLNQ